MNGRALSIAGLVPLILCCLLTSARAANPDAEFFERKIRPVLAKHCFSCHSSALTTGAKGELALDTKAGLARGGLSGLEIVPGKPAESRLLLALRYTDPGLTMPPAGKLPDSVIADFEAWIARGAFDPRVDPAGGAAPGSTRALSVEDGRRWWAFQPLASHVPPRPRNPALAAWP